MPQLIPLCTCSEQVDRKLARFGRHAVKAHIRAVIALAICALAAVATAQPVLGYRPTPSWIPYGPGGQDVTALAYNAGTPQSLYIAIRSSGVYRSDDRGVTWVAANNGLPSGANVTTLLSPTKGKARLVALADGEPYVTSDNGVHWLSANAGLPARPGMSVGAVIPGTAASLLLGGVAGLFISIDMGAHWRQLNGGLPARGHITFITVSDKSRGVILAGVGNVHVHGGNVYRSDDFGQHWREADHGLPAAYVPAKGQWSLHSDGTAWVAAGGIYRTDDKGGHWRRDGFGLPAQSIVSAMIFGKGDSGFLATGTAFYARPSGSSAWQRVEEPWPGRSAVHALAITADDSPIAATAAGVYRARGEGWTDAGVGLPMATSVYSLAATHDGALVAGVADGAWRANAANWISMGEGLPVGSNVHTIIELPYAPYRLYCATDYGIFQLNDARNYWQMVGGAPAGRAVSAFAYARGSDTLYAAVAGDAIYAAPAATLHWKAIANSGRLGYIHTLLVEAHSRWIIAESHRSADNGHSWKRTGLNGILTAIQLHDHTGTIIAGTANSGAFSSDDGGAHWAPINISGGQSHNVSLLFGTWSGETAIAVAFAGSLPYVSVDSGQSWRPLAPTAPAGPVTSASLAPGLPLNLVVGTVGYGTQLLSQPIALPQSATGTPVSTSTLTITPSSTPTREPTSTASRTITNTPSTTPIRVTFTVTATRTPITHSHPTPTLTPTAEPVPSTDTPVPSLMRTNEAEAPPRIH